MEGWRGVLHRHILPFLGYATYPQVVLISPFCQHGNLSSFLEGHPAANRVKLLSEAASGLQFLHQHNPPIVHSDIKPDNILVNDALEAVLADFGQSRFMHNIPSPYVTEDILLGTPRYMAPELLEDETAKHTLPSDIYAFSLVTLEVLSGRSAFYSIRMNIILAVQRGLRPLPQDHPNQACQQIWPLLAQGWDESPNQRPQIGEFIQWLKHLPDTTGPSTPTSPTSTRSTTRIGHERTRSAVPISRSLPIHRTSTGVRTTRSVTPTGPADSPVSPVGPFPHLSRDRCVVHGKRYDIWQGTRNIGAVRMVAIKFLRSRSGQWAARDDNQRFDRQYRCWKDLNHPNVLPLIDYSVEDRFFVSPWCANGPVKVYIQRFPSADKLDLIIQVAQGLDYLHRGSYPMVHGHLIPNQILVDSDGVVKISGFGYSVFLQDLDAGGVWSAPEDITSIRYTAPEVLNGLDHSTPSDIYSMAFIALEILSSTVPYPFLNGGALIRAIADGVRPAREQYIDALGHCTALWALFDQCLALDPFTRPSARTVQNVIRNRATQLAAAAQIPSGYGV
ncbi:hypothetical protein M407DRAFT_30658 [Tulasnella calospora MUT 4182]|uniref:Protein kinase domain-containing protein n=1 Tax=Tulasnella calospora MUT 4182 TaxID=1051891 RepID=A0A0C3LE07_9AGAM|nr:hypothetical protein M407DRAFT_30658 [Tulasnella calospora MUT 4182]